LKWNCVQVFKYKDFIKYVEKAELMMEEGKKWEEVEKIIQKLRFRDFKRYVETSFKAF